MRKEKVRREEEQNTEGEGGRYEKGEEGRRMLFRIQSQES